jgi:uncharacterized protein (DUF1697 family)
MTAYVALVRAVNVTGTGMLPKEKLKAMGEACGFANVRTFINSGNLLFTSDLAEAAVKRRLEAKVTNHLGKAAHVYVRSAKEMADAVRKNPFSEDKPSSVMTHFIDEKPAKTMLDEARDVQGERMALGPRLIYVSYGDGMGKTKLKLPAVKQGTARNMNTVAKIADLLAGME